MDEKVTEQAPLEEEKVVQQTPPRAATPSKGKGKFLLVFFILIIVGLIGVSGYFIANVGKSTQQVPSTAKKQLIIGLSLGTLKEERWQRDRDNFVSRAQALGAKVVVESANSDIETQKSQIESLILQHVSVLVIVPQDDKAIVPIVQEARQKGIKVIAYDRIIANTPLDGYVTVDYVKAGMQQAQAVLDAAKSGNFAIVMGDQGDSTVAMQKEGIEKVLNPVVKAGKVKIVYEDFTKDWLPELAYKNMKKLLLTHADIKGVVAMNDGTASGVIQALQEDGLVGKVAVSGMDAELAGCQRIVKGTQTETSYLPVKLQAVKAADVAVAFAKGETPEFNGQTPNGANTVATYFVQPVAVTKENMQQTIIKDGFHTYQEVYQKSL